MGVISVVRRTSQRLMPSIATCQRTPMAGIHSWMYWKCQPVVIGTESSQSEATKVTPITPSVKPRRSPSICRGMKSTATAPTMGSITSTLSR